ncbi:MAG: hypothetical protein DRN95_00015 [Candidatus Hydrothermarchaeota archaeon]|nr:MAG: hypothetical protein DRN95_00015 [Candidatus Hydrothermarchaeota archaeon]
MELPSFREINIKERIKNTKKYVEDRLVETLAKAGKDLTLEKYLTSVFAPLVIFGILVSVVLKMFVFSILSLSGFVTMIPYILPFACFILAIIYPFLFIHSRAKDIDTKIHLFITYLSVISTTGAERKILFRMASEKEEFGTVTKEMQKIMKVADAWGMGFVRACRLAAKTTPSIIFKDFLERLAHAFQAGEEIGEFLRQEVDVVMNGYERMYKQALYKIDTMNDMYLNLIVTLAFVAAFALIFPMLTDLSMTSMVYMMIFLFLMADLGLYTFTKAVTPTDPLYHSLPIKTPGRERIESLILPVGIVTFILFFLLLILDKFSLPVKIAISQTPWLLVGFLALKEEQLVRRKDDNFPTFIRTVGNAAGVRGGSITPVIGTIRLHNYGPLTENIHALYRRLSLGDVEASWRYFAGESGSNLIDKFSRIFIEATYAGGDPPTIGETISKTFIRINNLRKFRLQSAVKLRAMLYSSMIGIAISIYVVVWLVKALGKIFMKFSVGEGKQYLPTHFAFGSFNLDFILFLIWILIVLHAAFSAIVIKITDGGDSYNALMHYVILLWIGVFISIITPKAFTSFVPL